MPKIQTPAYIKGVLKPSASPEKQNQKKVWSIDLQTVWIPFYIAANANGDANVSREALGAPLRLAKEKDGTVRFSDSGKPIVRVAKELTDKIKAARENYVASLMDFTGKVIKGNAEGYKNEVLACQKAGAPINAATATDLEAAIAAREARTATDEAEAVVEAAASKAPSELVPA